MAISGSGTQADPYIVHDWDEFCTYKDTSGVYIKFANPHEGQTIQGSGTASSPYIVSSYEEMLTATGAQYIWQVKLIDRDAKKYKFGDVYCQYDDSLSTIDFNNIQPEGFTEQLTMNCAGVNFNGWTLKNMAFYSSSNSIGMPAVVDNLILSNLVSNGLGNGTLFDGSKKISNTIFDIFCTSISTTARLFSKRSGLTTDNIEISNCSFNVKGSGDGLYFGTSAAHTGTIKNSRINLDIDMSTFIIGEKSSYSNGFDTTNVLFTGNVKTSGTGNVYIGRTVNNCIYDLSYEGNGKLALNSSSSVATASFYNSDKIEDVTGLNVANMISATTSNLKDAEWLYSQGFPIGV